MSATVRPTELPHLYRHIDAFYRSQLAERKVVVEGRYVHNITKLERCLLSARTKGLRKIPTTLDRVSSTASSFHERFRFMVIDNSGV